MLNKKVQAQRPRPNTRPIQRATGFSKDNLNSFFQEFGEPIARVIMVRNPQQGASLLARWIAGWLIIWEGYVFHRKKSVVGFFRKFYPEGGNDREGEAQEHIETCYRLLAICSH